MSLDRDLFIPAGAGEAVWFGGQGAVFKVPGAATRGAFAIVEHPTEPGRLVPPHAHYGEDELSIVLEGEELDALAQKYRCEYLMDWVPDLTARYGLKLLGQ